MPTYTLHSRDAQGQSSDPRKSAEQLLTIIKSLPDVIFQCERRRDGRIYWTLNEGRLAEEFHLTTDQIKDKPLNELFPPDTVARILPEFEHAFEGVGHEFTNELGGRYFKHYPQPVVGPDGHVSAVVGFISEVTNLVKAEQQIEQLNAELRRRLDDLVSANRELEAFSASVSHDLRTPLTVLDNRLQLLLDRDRETLSPKSRESVDQARAAIRQMDQLIGDMLRFSKSAADRVRKDDVDLGALAQLVALELQELEPGRKVEWSLAKNVVAKADGRLMRSVLQNLLANAWKFTADQARPRIEFGVAQKDGGERNFYVRDNGHGFDPSQASELFRAFHRLPSSGPSEGTGVGLATVKRIIDRHGGRVWADGTPGKGATFYFTL